MEPLLRVDRLTVAFPVDGVWAPVVRELDLELARGEILGLVGESGCGKSMTARAILGLVPAPGRIEGGAVRLAEPRAPDAGARVTRVLRGGRVGLVFQEPSAALDPLFRIGRQLEEAIHAHRALGAGELRDEALRLLELVSMPEPRRAWQAYPHQLSGGQRQRVTIALALAGEPEVLVADEPTTALDVTIQAQILDLLTRLRDELGLAVLLITHDLAVVAETCDRIAVMYAGEVVEEGDVEAVFRRPAHPYTRGLLAAVPVLGAADRALVGIAGRVPAAGELPDGCAFHPRCPLAVAECSSRVPIPVTVSPSHRSRCHLVEPAVRENDG